MAPMHPCAFRAGFPDDRMDSERARRLFARRGPHGDRGGRLYSGRLPPQRRLRMTDAPTPTEIKLRSRSRLLEVTFADGSRFELPFEYLRVHSPSAEVKGHGPGQEVLVRGKQDVGIRAVEPVGQYAVRLVFDDGHDTGLYSWKYLYELGRDRERNWARYLERCRAAAGHP